MLGGIPYSSGGDGDWSDVSAVAVEENGEIKDTDIDLMICCKHSWANLEYSVGLNCAGPTIAPLFSHAQDVAGIGAVSIRM